MIEKLFVIKIGGNIIDDKEKLNLFLKDFASIPDQIDGCTVKKILVHGGGKIATKIGEQLGLEATYINGRRITDDKTIDLVTMVYGGLVNKNIVAQLQALQCNALGLTGADANIISAVKRPPVIVSPTAACVDFGFVGDVDAANSSAENLFTLVDQKFNLVIAPLTHNGNGQLLNTNADTIASVLAVTLSKKYDVRLIYCFEKKGVLADVADETSVIPLITQVIYKQLVDEKKLVDGILPKVDNAFEAVSRGVNEVLIGDARDLLQNLTTQTTGTLIKNDYR